MSSIHFEIIDTIQKRRRNVGCVRNSLAQDVHKSRDSLVDEPCILFIPFHCLTIPSGSLSYT